MVVVLVVVVVVAAAAVVTGRVTLSRPRGSKRGYPKIEPEGQTIKQTCVERGSII